MAEKDGFKEKVKKHFTAASSVDPQKIKGKARNEFNVASGASLGKIKGKAQKHFNEAANIQERQDEVTGNGKHDNSGELSKAKGQRGPEDFEEIMSRAAKQKKGKEIHKKTTTPIKSHSPKEPSP